VRTATDELPLLSLPERPWLSASARSRVSAGLASKLLDEEAEVAADPCAGWEIGPCEVIRRLSPGEPHTLLALRTDENAGAALVVLKRAEGSIQEVLNRAHQLAGIRHPNLSRVYECEVSEDDVFWVSEFAPGATLAEIATACRKTGMAMPLGVVLAAVYEAALAIDSLRVGAMPRAFRTGDIVVTFSGPTKLACFAPDEPAPVSESHAARGVFRPEVFSLGAILYECLCGEAVSRPPSRREWVSPSRLNISVSSELESVVKRALYLDGEEPFRSARLLAEALKDAAGSFMWRELHRAELVSNLFPTRARRTQVLLAGCFDGRFASAPRAFEAPADQRPTPPVPPPLPRRRAKPLPALEGTPTPRIHRAAMPLPVPRPRAGMSLPRRNAVVPARGGRAAVRERPTRPLIRLRFIVAALLACGAAAYAFDWVKAVNVNDALDCAESAGRAVASMWAEMQ
jgi:hypothetical protein